MMARFGKGKPMAVQASAVLKGFLSLESRHAAKRAAGIHGSRSTGRIHSLSTFHKYANALTGAGEWGRQYAGLRFLKAFTPALAQQYLADRAAQGTGQKQLDTDRVALEFVIGKGLLEREHACNQAALHSRAYTLTQIELVMSHQSPGNALATEIAWRAGLRAHELFTLERSREAEASAHRRWSSERFAGRDGVRFIVTGKGGLRREVLVPHELAVRLEGLRLEHPRLVTDRHIQYRQRYHLGGGNAWSKSFGDASKRVLGWSNGGHGLRHSYVQARMSELQEQGKRYYHARDIVSQEIGHFRGDIVEVYLR